MWGYFALAYAAMAFIIGVVLVAWIYRHGRAMREAGGVDPKRQIVFNQALEGGDRLDPHGQAAETAPDERRELES